MERFKDFLSIVIPVYNTAFHLHTLMEQLKPQVKRYLDNSEIIVVDDGSTDEDIVWVLDYSNTFLLRKENGGAASARNVGLDLARGEYITFVDSDDQVLPNYMDVVFENHRVGYDWVSYEWESDGVPITSHFPDPLMVNCGICMYSFRADFIGGERFNERMNVREDQDFLIRVLRNDCKHKHDKRIIYNYRWKGNFNSLSHRFLNGELRELKG